MRSYRFSLVAGLISCALASCSSGGGTPTCSFKDPATLAQSAWPKFRHDAQNTGAVDNPSVSMNSGQMRWVFPPMEDNPKGPFAASPVINGVATDPASATRIYIGSADGHMYAVNPSTGAEDTSFGLATVLPITSTALVASRDGQDAIVVGGGDGNLYALGPTGAAQPTNWPFGFGSFVSMSPTLNTTDGTVYVGSLSGLFFGVCPNGAGRFGLSLVGLQSSPALGADGTVYFGADDQQLRALRTDGVLKFAFAASGAILAAPVVDPSDGSIYFADRRGQVFKITSAGSPITDFNFTGQNGGLVGPILSSPALAGNHLYFGSDDGNLYAVDKATGKIDWTFPTGAEIVSSPAVATGGAQPVVVVGSNDGNVYFVADNGTAAPQALAVFTIGAAVRSSPAIGSDGTVYVGADDGRLYAIQ